MGIPGACRTQTNCAPPPPPSPPVGQYERTRFFQKGYRGINKGQLHGDLYQPYGGLVKPEMLQDRDQQRYFKMI
jgi:hypothetical protein